MARKMKPSVFSPQCDDVASPFKMRKFILFLLATLLLCCPGLLAGKEKTAPGNGGAEGVDPAPAIDGDNHFKLFSAIDDGALPWFKANQAENGSWSPKQNPEAMTALAVWAFISNGWTPTSEKYGETLQKAISWLVVTLRKRHGRLEDDDFTHAVSTLALAETYRMTTPGPFVKPAMETAVKTIVKGQQPAGGFAKSYAQGDKWDLDFSAWNIMALYAADIADADTPGLKEALKKAAQFLLMTANTDGLFRQTPSADGDVLSTAQGLYLLSLVGENHSKQSRQAKAIIQSYTPVWEKGTSLPAASGFFFMDQARFHSGVKTFRTWWSPFVIMVMTHQHADGHWESPKGDVYSGQPADPYYTTALMALSITDPTRFSPRFPGTRETGKKDPFNLDDEGF